MKFSQVRLDCGGGERLKVSNEQVESLDQTGTARSRPARLDKQSIEQSDEVSVVQAVE